MDFSSTTEGSALADKCNVLEEDFFCELSEYIEQNCAPPGKGDSDAVILILRKLLQHFKRYLDRSKREFGFILCSHMSNCIAYFTSFLGIPLMA